MGFLSGYMEIVILALWTIVKIKFLWVLKHLTYPKEHGKRAVGGCWGCYHKSKTGN